MGTLGAGNHYAEIQVVEEVFDKAAARKMGIDKVGQVCIMIHSGSRGLGHQVDFPPYHARHGTKCSNTLAVEDVDGSSSSSSSSTDSCKIGQAAFSCDPASFRSHSMAMNSVSFSTLSTFTCWPDFLYLAQYLQLLLGWGTHWVPTD